MSDTDKEKKILAACHDAEMLLWTGKENPKQKRAAAAVSGGPRPVPSHIHFTYTTRAVRDLIEITVSVKRPKRSPEDVGKLVFRPDEYEQFKSALASNVNHNFKPL